MFCILSSRLTSRSPPKAFSAAPPAPQGLQGPEPPVETPSPLVKAAASPSTRTSNNHRCRRRDTLPADQRRRGPGMARITNACGAHGVLRANGQHVEQAPGSHRLVTPIGHKVDVGRNPPNSGRASHSMFAWDRRGSHGWERSGFQSTWAMPVSRGAACSPPLATPRIKIPEVDLRSSWVPLGLSRPTFPRLRCVQTWRGVRVPSRGSTPLSSTRLPHINVIPFTHYVQLSNSDHR